MDAKLFQTAQLGDAENPWRTALRVGAEALKDAASFSLESTSRDDVFFCERDDREYLTTEQADHVIKRYNPYIGVGSRKLAPFNRLEQTIQRLAFYDSISFPLSEDDCASLCGNVGRFLVLISSNTYWKRNLPPLFPYRGLEPQVVERIALRTIESDEQLPERANAFLALRNVAPAKAREVLARYWNVDDREEEKKLAKVRARFFDAFWKNLSDDDVPLLEERAINDSLAISRKAYKMLATLPTSKYYRYARERGDAILTDDGELVEPKYKKEFKKEGIPKETGETYVARLLGTVPLEHWEERFQATPLQLAERFPFSEKTEALYAGWGIAFVNYGGVSDWLKVLYPMVDAEGRGKLQDKALEKLMRQWDSDVDYVVFAGLRGSYRGVLDGCMSHKISDFYLAKELEGLQKDAESNDNAEFEIFRQRIAFEPTPWSEEFENEYYRLVFEAPKKQRDAWSRVCDELPYFSPAMRVKILEQLRQLCAKSNPKARWLLSEAEKLFNDCEEGDRLFGVFRDYPPEGLRPGQIANAPWYEKYRGR